MFELDGQKFHLSLRRFLDLRWNGVVLRLQDRDKAIIPISFGMALTDPLTGLGNRRSLIESLASFARQNISFGIIQLDLDHFKTVNDQLGHPVGDRVLVELSNILRQEIRAHDVAVRLGGDEFILLITGTNDPTELLGLAERLLARLKPPLTIQTHKVQLGLSMGGRIVEAAERWSMIDILQAVDQALYHSKRRGKGRFTFCS
jgi:diguanylate cyclase (GGDEF)-like protein